MMMVDVVCILIFFGDAGQRGKYLRVSGFESQAALYGMGTLFQSTSRSDLSGQKMINWSVRLRYCGVYWSLDSVAMIGGLMELDDDPTANGGELMTKTVSSSSIF
jgi:hypothetical protein